MLEEILDLFFPPNCLLCGRRNKLIICNDCFGQFETYDNTRINKNVMWDNISSVSAAGIYSGNLKEAIHIFKYKNGKRLAEPFARYMITKLPDLNERADSIAYVPLTRYKEASRGYNQAFLLAKELSKKMDIPLYRGLSRIRETHVQNTLGPDERMTNVDNAFAARKNVPDSILLVDDIFTTGSTVNECARALRTAGAKNVYVATIARAIMEKD